MAHLISYAQNFEDIMLWRALARVEGGCYIDVGAQSPHVDSVSKVFYEHGWRGILVGAMRGAIKVPLLRRPAGAVLGLSPPLRRRLRGIAGSAGLIEGDAPPAPRLTDKGAAGGDASRPRPQGQPVLSRRARRVLADLKQSIEESPN